MWSYAYYESTARSSLSVWHGVEKLQTLDAKSAILSDRYSWLFLSVKQAWKITNKIKFWSHIN